MLREFSAGGIILKKEKEGIRVLLIKDSYGRWTWPKGNIEKNESSKDAAIREINEEVGLDDIEVIDKLETIEYFYHLKGELIFKKVYLFLVRAKSAQKLNPLKLEIEEAGWLSSQDALAKVDYKGAREILEKALVKFGNLE